MPRLAKWLWDGLELPYEEYSMDQVPDAPKAVWWIDNFGNCKTTILPEEIAFEHGKIVQTKYGEFTCYNHLKDVPNEVTALIIGSSGLEHKRFVEFVIQGKSAAAKFGLSTGDVLID
jgi:S-adenosylmethionine hydrolase